MRICKFFIQAVMVCVLCVVWCTQSVEVQASVKSAAQLARASLHVAATASRQHVMATAQDASFEHFVRRQAALEAQVGFGFYKAGDDWRAITALRRHQMLAKDDDATFISQLAIGHMYHRNQKYAQAAYNFEQAIPVAASTEARVWAYLLGLQEICVPLALYVECRGRLREAAHMERVSVVQRELMAYQSLFVDVVLRDPDVQQQDLVVFTTPEFRVHALALKKRDVDFHNLPLQRPWLAALMSGVVPGTGQLYNGRLGDSAVAFGMTVGLGVSTYYAFAEWDSVPLGVLLSVLLGGFYVGNIINAYTDAERINASRYMSFFEALSKEHWARVRFTLDHGRVRFGYRFDWPGSHPQEEQHTPPSHVKEPGSDEVF